jgi:hypothetical protein
MRYAFRRTVSSKICKELEDIRERAPIRSMQRNRSSSPVTLSSLADAVCCQPFDATFSAAGGILLIKIRCSGLLPPDHTESTPEPFTAQPMNIAALLTAFNCGAGSG